MLEVNSPNFELTITRHSKLILFRMDLFGAAHGWGQKDPLIFKICHT